MYCVVQNNDFIIVPIVCVFVVVIQETEYRIQNPWYQNIYSLLGLNLIASLRDDPYIL